MAPKEIQPHPSNLGPNIGLFSRELSPALWKVWTHGCDKPLNTFCMGKEEERTIRVGGGEVM